MRPRLAGWSLTRLRLWLVLFFLALAIPTAALIRHAYGQLKWESFHFAQSLAQEVTRQIERDFALFIQREEARAYGEYTFLAVGGDPDATFLRRSALAELPQRSGVPGLLGHFQVGDDGAFSTPLLPETGVISGQWGIDADELAQRQAVASRLRNILRQNRLVEAGSNMPSTPSVNAGGMVASDTPSSAAEEAAALVAGPVQREKAAPVDSSRDRSGQALFDRLDEAHDVDRSDPPAPSLGTVEDLRLARQYSQAARKRAPEREADSGERKTRRELAAVPANAPSVAAATREREILSAGGETVPTLRIRTFESEIDPLQFSRLDSGEFVLYRKVWRDGRREIQGLLVESQAWLRGMVEPLFRASAIAQSTDLVVAYRKSVLALFGSHGGRAYPATAAELEGALLSRSRLAAPLGDLELIFSVRRLPPGSGAAVLAWLTAILGLVLVGGFLLLERLGTAQIRLARQQQDFVSAVSHELKTPLTSIRMYAEMLGEGWAAEEKKAGYYAYIREESERLSRLIENVLQLARLTRNDLQVHLGRKPVAQLVDGIRSRVEAPLGAAGFTLSLQCDPRAASRIVEIDEDLFAQIIINLVDNAVKFAAGAEHRQVDIAADLTDGDSVTFSVRDYGPGLPAAQMKKIFTLFYRMENELTRETAGTGIGLALVRQLAEAMGGTVDVRNRQPGAQFSVAFPSTAAGQATPEVAGGKD